MRVDGREIRGNRPPNNWLTSRSMSSLKYKKEKILCLLAVNNDGPKIREHPQRSGLSNPSARGNLSIKSCFLLEYISGIHNYLYGG